MTKSASERAAARLADVAAALIIQPARLVHFLIFNLLPVLLVVTLATFMFTPPDLVVPPIDRAGTLLLLGLTLCAVLLRRQRLPYRDPLLWLMIGLTALAVASAPPFELGNPAWSGMMAKLITPLLMFLVARSVLVDVRAQTIFFVFAAAALAYLDFLAIADLVGADFLIFPRYILDPTLGIHAGRARGPFVQAVANGVAINMLALLVLYWFDRTRRRGLPMLLLLTATSLAIMATLTRSVWLGFGLSALMLMVFRASPQLRRAGLQIAVVAGIGLAGVLLLTDFSQTLYARFYDEDPVTFRTQVYWASFEMWKAAPIFGWGTGEMEAMLPHFVEGFSPGESVAAHNTFIEVAVEQGVVGLALYLAVFACLFGMGRRLPFATEADREDQLIDRRFLFVWRLILVVYLINAMFVVMNYQFINAMLFVIAGAIAGTEARMAASGAPARAAGAGAAPATGGRGSA